MSRRCFKSSVACSLWLAVSCCAGRRRGHERSVRATANASCASHLMAGSAVVSLSAPPSSAFDRPEHPAPSCPTAMRCTLLVCVVHAAVRPALAACSVPPLPEVWLRQPPGRSCSPAAASSVSWYGTKLSALGASSHHCACYPIARPGHVRLVRVCCARRRSCL